MEGRPPASFANVPASCGVDSSRPSANLTNTVNVVVLVVCCLAHGLWTFWKAISTVTTQMSSSRPVLSDSFSTGFHVSNDKDTTFKSTLRIVLALIWAYHEEPTAKKHDLYHEMFAPE